MTSDQQLIDIFLTGDESAFNELVARYQKRLYAFTYRMVSDREDAMDLTQKTFVQVFLKARGFEGRSSFKTWLFRIAVNLSLNHLRGNGRNPAVPGKKEDTIDTITLTAGCTALDTIVLKERRTMLSEAVSALPERQMTVVALRIYQELTFQEIADVMQCAVGTAKANYHHALCSLKKNMRGNKSQT